jgi:hypothetical protein
MKFFRKNTKWMMAIFGSLLMVMFLLPTTPSSQSGGPDYVRATFVDATGETHEIRIQDLQNRNNELNILNEIGFSFFSNPQYLLLSQDPELGRIHPSVELVAYQLFFAGPRDQEAIRYLLEQMVANTMDSVDHFELVRDQIATYADAGTTGAGMYYYLLVEEARRAGFHATQDQISTIMLKRDQLVEQRVMQPLALYLESRKITENHVRTAIGNYLSVLQYANAVTQPMAVNASQLKKLVRDDTEFNSVSGNYVSFTTYLFDDQVADPTDADLETLFNQFKEVDPAGEIDEETNPHRFGYELPDRLKVEILKVDIAEAKAAVETNIADMPIQEQESAVQDFWSKNKRLFQVRNPAATPENGLPQFNDPIYDDVADKARDLWIEDQAKADAEKLLLDIRQDITLSPQADQWEQASGQYAEAAAQASAESLAVKYVISDYLTSADLSAFESLGQTVMQSSGRQPEPILNQLFYLETLVDAAEAPSVDPPELLETLGPLTSYDYQQRPSAVLLIRPVGADPRRVPTSLADDGRFGPAESDPGNTEDSKLYDLVKANWKNVQAYQLTLKQAEIFQENAAGDWEKAVKDMNDLLNAGVEPNSPSHNPNKLRPQTVESDRDLMQRYIDYARQQQGSTQFNEAIRRQQALVQKAMELAQERHGQQGQGRGLLSLPADNRVLVFENLDVKPPTQQEYLRQRPRTAWMALDQQQFPATIAYFNPENIKLRSGFQENSEPTDQQEPEATPDT